MSASASACAGLFGRLFGHKYRPAFNTTMPEACGRFLNGLESLSGPQAPEFIRSLKDDTLAGYICQRCGDKISTREVQP